MNTPFVLVSAPTVPKPHPRQGHRSKRRRLAAFLANLTLIGIYSAALLSGIAAGGRLAVFTRDLLHGQNPIPVAAAAPPSSSVVSAPAFRQATIPVTTTPDAASFSRAFRLYNKPVEASEKDAGLSAHPPPSA